ncbi:Cwf15/Cwc15 cell cycle control protein-domain-containing protein [Piptocephalis cylindrospora]|uniref:Cwf15/Cwc15 cell cycle control protein-domain-containing protein n=1 Tax=Piptocephalis cylindrospora TaxID=1907219 RepID=A0A4P9Y6R0_9FUNG|nr:Cwf15/Cwc15 cell cycle control protein-domain-containing protein [Piptocephalis cylindrospora]|eukprot:RKP14653.1 Cwf15/Cwc15 cell cycle control protein-domain-containing protein [Piptocephalis cylindrospora]
MTTAARPTFDPAKGRATISLTRQYAARDIAAHTKLKYRYGSEGVIPVYTSDLLTYSPCRYSRRDEVPGLGDPEVDEEALREDLRRREAKHYEQQLLRELEKIRRERAEEKERVKGEQDEAQAETRRQQAVTGNPLLQSGDFTMKRRWDDDVIFKNQARGVNDKAPKRFVNDTLRSDFHRKFMHKYIR